MKTLTLSAALCFMVAAESTAIKYVRIYQKNDIPSEQLVLIVEIVKCTICACLYGIQNYKHNKSEPFETTPILAEENVSEIIEIDKLEDPRQSSIIWFMFPAVLYTVSNNVTFEALSRMSPAMFNLLMNLKIPFTAIMAWLFIRYKFNKVMVASFAALFAGSAIATLKFNEQNKLVLQCSIYGLLLMIVYSFCSASAAVYMEYITKMRYEKESLWLQNVKFCACSMIANIVIIFIRGRVPFTTLEPLHLLAVLGLVGNGLMTSAVIKFGGSIVKTYAVSVAMFLSAISTMFLFQIDLKWTFFFGAGVSAVAVNLYAWEKRKGSTA